MGKLRAHDLMRYENQDMRHTHVQRFLDDTIDEHAKRHEECVTPRELYTAYLTWFETCSEHVKPLKRINLAYELEYHRAWVIYRGTHSRGKRRWKGKRLRVSSRSHEGDTVNSWQDEVTTDTGTSSKSQTDDPGLPTNRSVDSSVRDDVGSAKDWPDEVHGIPV